MLADHILSLLLTAHSDEFCQCQGCVGKYTLLRDEENPRLAILERRLPCCGCGIGWSSYVCFTPLIKLWLKIIHLTCFCCSFLLGFVCPSIWYFAATLYCCKYYNRDPRERPGLAASAVAVSPTP